MAPAQAVCNALLTSSNNVNACQKFYAGFQKVVKMQVSL